MQVAFKLRDIEQSHPAIARVDEVLELALADAAGEGVATQASHPRRLGRAHVLPVDGSRAIDHNPDPFLSRADNKKARELVTNQGDTLTRYGLNAQCTTWSSGRTTGIFGFV